MPADPHQRDEAITAAVIELLRTKGPKAVNVEAVAAQAGVAKTTIYRRFRDREDDDRRRVDIAGQPATAADYLVAAADAAVGRRAVV